MRGCELNCRLAINSARVERCRQVWFLIELHTVTVIDILHIGLLNEIRIKQARDRLTNPVHNLHLATRLSSSDHRLDATERLVDHL